MNTINSNTNLSTSLTLKSLGQLEKEGKVNAELKKEAMSEPQEQTETMKTGS